MNTELEKLKTRLFGGLSAGNVKFFPGFNREKGPEDWARQLNGFFISAEVDGLKSIDVDEDLDG